MVSYNGNPIVYILNKKFLIIPKLISNRLKTTTKVARYEGLETFSFLACCIRNGIESHPSRPKVLTNVSNHIFL